MDGRWSHLPEEHRRGVCFDPALVPFAQNPGCYFFPGVRESLDMGIPQYLDTNLY